VLFVMPVRQHVLAALAHHDRGAGVLAHRQDAARRDAGVLQQVASDVPVVGRGLRVVEDGPELTEVRGAQQVLDVADRRGRELGDRCRFHFQERPAERRVRAHAAVRDLAVGGVVMPGRK
jgi:hypothetical protein